MSDFTFSPEHAVKYGVNEAIFIKHLQFWITKNKANDKNHFEGRTWTYNSQEALTKLFPFWNRGKIKRLLQSLVGQGIILKGNFNKKQNDRTNWYAFKNEEEFIDAKLLKNNNDEKRPLIGQKRPMDCPKVTNGLVNNDQPLPVNNTDIKTVKKEKNKKEKNKKEKFELPDFINQEVWNEFISIREKKKAVNSPYALTKLINKLERLYQQGHDPTDLMNTAIINGWKDIYEPKELKNEKYSRNNKEHNQQGFSGRRASTSEQIADAAKRFADQHGI